MADTAPASSHGTAGTDPQLVHWLEKASTNPLHLPALWRAMKHSELHVIVPCETESSEEIELGQDDALSIVTLEDGKDHYTPVFTNLEEAEETAARLGGGFGVASAEGLPIFVMLANSGHRIVINPFKAPHVHISPEAVHDLATTGHVSRFTLETAQEHIKLVPVSSRDVPHDLLVTLRGCCAKHRRAVAGLYIFHPMRDDALEPDRSEYRFMLRMNQSDEAILKEIKGAAMRGLPAGANVTCTAITGVRTETLAFLDTVRPIWPV